MDPFAMRLARPLVAVAVRPNDGTRVDPYLAAEDAPGVDHHPGKEDRTVSNLDLSSHDDVRMERNVVSQAAPSTDDRIRSHRTALAEHGIGSDDGGGMDTRLGDFFLVKQLQAA
jgi:hypothetical protein